MLRAKFLILIGFVAFLLFLAARIPIDTALGLSGIKKQISYSQVEGTLSHLVLRDVSWGSLVLEKLELVPSWSAFLSGGNKGHLRFQGANGLYGRFNYSASETSTVSDLVVQSEIQLALASGRARGTIVLEGDSLEVGKQGQCIAGSVGLRTNVMTELLKSLDIDGPVVVGAISCEAGAYAVSVSGANDVLSIVGSGAVALSGKLPLDVTIGLKSQKSAAEDLQSFMEFAGFRKVDSGWRGTVNLELFK